VAQAPYAYLAAAGLIVLLLGYLLWAAPAHPRRTATAVVALNLIAWMACEIWVIGSATAEQATLAIRATYAAIGCLPFTVNHLVLVLTGATTSRAASAVATGLFAVFAVASLPTGILIAGAEWLDTVFHRIPGPGFHVFAPALFLLLAWDVVLLWRATRTAVEPLDRLRCQHMLAGVGLNVGLGVLDLAVLQPLGIQAHRAYVAPLGLVVAAGTFGYATANSRLLDVPTALRRSAVYAVMLAALLVPCLGISLLSERLMTGEIDVGPSFVTALLLCVASFGFPRLQVSAQRTLEQALFGGRADDRRVLRAASRDVTSVLSLRTLAEVTRDALARVFDDVDVGLWLRRGGELEPVEPQHRQLGHLAARLATLDAGTDPLVLAEVAERDRNADVRGLRAAGIEVVVPLRVKDRVVGLLTLGPRGDRSLYTDDDLALVATLANQVAIALENARLYEELRESREQVSRASRLSAVGTLAAGIAHEIRNPLVAVRTFLQLLPQRLDDPEFRDGFRALALEEVERVSQLTTQLLTFARSHERKLGRVDVGEVASHVVQLLASEATSHDVQLALETPSRTPPVYADAEQLQQVVVNLVLNAIQASPADGVVTVRVEPVGGPEGAAYVVLTVTDEGPGVPAENLEAVFAPFFTTKDGSTGLGLSVAHQLVSEHGGTLTVASPPGAGATFRMMLPVAARNVEAEQPPPAPASARPRWGHELTETPAA